MLETTVIIVGAIIGAVAAMLAAASAIAWRRQLAKPCHDLFCRCSYWRNAVYLWIGYLYLSRPAEAFLRCL